MAGFAALLFCFAGGALLAIAMARHQRHSLGRNLDTRARQALRIGGATCWLLALALSIAHWGVAIGITVWMCCLPLLNVPVAIVITYAPRRLVTGIVIASGTAALLTLHALIVGPLNDPFPFAQPASPVSAPR